VDIGNFAPGTDSMDSDAEIEKHERQLEQTLLQLKIAKSVAEAKQTHN
jgi:ribosomal protein L29